MFKISPINDPAIQKKYAQACGTEYKDGYFAYSMTDSDSDELMGFSQFEINSNGGLITDLLPIKGSFDYEAMFILGRATMNFIDLCGSHTCFAHATAGDEKLLHAIGFRRYNDELLICDMNGMFDGNCSGK